MSSFSETVMKRCFIAVVLVGCLSTSLAQTSVPIPNSSFEQPDSAEDAPSATIPGWAVDSGGGYAAGPLSGVGIYDPTSAQYPSSLGGYIGAGGENALLPGSAAGGQAAFVALTPGGGASFSEILSPALENVVANTRYDLTIALGHRADYNPGAILIGLAIGHGLETSLVTIQSIQPGSIPVGTFQDFTISLNTVADGDLLVGQPLGFWLRMDAPGSGPPNVLDFDNLRLTTSVPEPSVGCLALLIAAYAALKKSRKRSYWLSSEAGKKCLDFRNP